MKVWNDTKKLIKFLPFRRLLGLKHIGDDYMIFFSFKNKIKIVKALTRIFKSASLSAGFVIILLFINSCNGCYNLDVFPDETMPGAEGLTKLSLEKSVSYLDKAMKSLDVASANWQDILQKLITDLPEEVQSTVTNEVSNLLTRTVAAAGAKVFCTVDFIPNRVKQALQRIKSKFLNQALPSLEPHLCLTNPEAIDMNLSADRRNKIEFFGYDFDITEIQVILFNGTNQINVSDKLDKADHYHMILNLGLNGIRLSSASTRIVLRWNDRDMWTIQIIQPEPDICDTYHVHKQFNDISYAPPLVKGDREFNGNGPNIFANVRLINGGNRLIARVYMRAQETRSDSTTGEGFKEYTLYTTTSGKIIQTVLSDLYCEKYYTDETVYVDEFYGYGPVRLWTFIGDTRGDDVERGTKVKISFNKIGLVLKDTGSCVTKSTIMMLKTQNAISPALLNLVNQ